MYIVLIQYSKPYTIIFKALVYTKIITMLMCIAIHYALTYISTN